MALPTLTSFNFLDPPRKLTTDASANFDQLNRYTWNLNKDVIPRVQDTITIVNAAREVLSKIAALEKIADPATATAEDVAKKVNEIIDAASIENTTVSEATESS